MLQGVRSIPGTCVHGMCVEIGRSGSAELSAIVIDDSTNVILDGFETKVRNLVQCLMK